MLPHRSGPSRHPTRRKSFRSGTTRRHDESTCEAGSPRLRARAQKRARSPTPSPVGLAGPNGSRRQPAPQRTAAGPRDSRPGRIPYPRPILDAISDGTPRRTREQSWRTPLWIFLAFLLLYQSNGRHLAEVDCVPAPYVAAMLVREGSFDLRAVPDLIQRAGNAVRELPDGSVLSKYPPGSSLAAVPFIAPLAVGTATSDWSHTTMARFGKRVASIYVAGIAVLLYLLCRRMAPAATAPTVVFIAAGTTLWSTASQALWTHAPATFFVCAAMYLLLRSREGPARADALIAGLAIGCAILTRPTTGLFGLASLAALLTGRRWRESLLFALPVLVLGSGLVLYNQTHFGNSFGGGYLDEAGRWETPLSVGLAGLLIAPSRGLLIYSPALWVLPLGLWSLGAGSSLSRMQRAVLGWWLLAVIGTLFVYARWHMWWGGWSYGPRFLSETIPLLGILFALATERLTARFGTRGRLVAWGLVLLSVSVHYLGVFGHGSAWMVGKHGGDMFSLEDTQIAAYAVHLWQARPASLLLPALVGSGLLVAWAIRSRQPAASRESSEP